MLKRPSSGHILSFGIYSSAKVQQLSLAQRPSSRPATLPTPLTAACFIRVNTAIAPRRTPILKLAVLDNAEFEVPIILGCVIAHEVWHLVLGSNSHSGSGIMQGHWERGQIRKAMTGNLPFTPEQVKLIQPSTFARVGRISGTQPWECGHGKSCHQSRRIDEKKFQSPCRFPGCDCRNYKPKKA